MNVYNHINEFHTSKDIVLTTGTFDGVHLGHKKIINQLLESAKQNNSESVILTFYPHPRKVLNSNGSVLKLLNTIDEKIQLLESSGIDHLIIHPFSIEFSNISSLDFVRDVLVKNLNTKKLVIGYDHHFGKNREGSFEHLKEYGHLYGFEVEEIAAHEIQQINVSSTKIRNSLMIGEIIAANKFLGYNYFLNGKVIPGTQTGRKIGFPTANIEVSDEMKLVPGNGVYAVKITLKHQEYIGMLNIGNRPTLNGKKESIEVNIFNFEQDIYNEPIRIEFVERIRNEIKFHNLEELKRQLTDDKTKVLQIFN